MRQAADRLTKYGLARLASGHSSRATKYRHLAEEGLGLGREELAVLAVLLLRGPQTPGELKARSDRMASIASLSDVERVLSVLADRGYVRRLGRRPGQKEDRFEQLLGGASAEANAGEMISAPVPTAPGTDPARRRRPRPPRHRPRPPRHRPRPPRHRPRPPRRRPRPRRQLPRRPGVPTQTATSRHGSARSKQTSPHSEPSSRGYARCSNSSRLRLAAPAPQGRSRRRRSRRQASSQDLPTTSCAASPATSPRRRGSARSAI